MHPDEQGPKELPDSHIDRSQLVDLVIEDEEAEQTERVRARKEGGDAWNTAGESKHFVRTYSVDGAPEGEDMRPQGFDPSQIPADHPPPERAVSDDEDEDEAEGSHGENGGRYGSMIEDDNVWR